MNYHFQPIGGAVMKCMWCAQSEVTMTFGSQNGIAKSEPE